MQDTYYIYCITLFNSKSLSHQDIDFSHKSEAIETVKRLKYFFETENLDIIVKLYEHEMDIDLTNLINSREIYL